MLYESFQMNYQKYFIGGKEDAEELISRAEPFCQLQTGRILDWGCGPARLIRHLPDLLGSENEYFGTDYNPSTIAWCRANIPGVHFTINDIVPPLSYPPEYFDLIYGISIFTHLSPDNHYRWAEELHKRIKPGGILYITTHGDAFTERLTRDEKIIYQQNQLVSRTKVKEGHRMYAAFQPPLFMEKVISSTGFTIQQHIPGQKINHDYISQDVWILRK